MEPNTRYTTNGFRVGKHFWLYEFECNCKDRGLPLHSGYCNGAAMIDPRMVEILDAIREKHGRTTIVSGYRCWKYHAHIYKLLNKKPTRASAHLSGNGADLWTQEPLRYPEHKNFLTDLGVTGIGYIEDGGRVIHIDNSHKELTTWTY